MKKGFGKTLFDAGASAVGRAAGVVLSDGRGQEAVARAVGIAQRGIRMFESAQEKALHLAGFAARPDYDDLHKQMARLKRKARELSRHLDSPGGAAASSGAGAGANGARGSSGGAARSGAAPADRGSR